MVMRVKRTAEIIMSNYVEILGSCVFTYEGQIAYANENMQILEDIPAILEAWKEGLQTFSVKNMAFIVYFSHTHQTSIRKRYGNIGIFLHKGFYLINRIMHQ